MISAMTLGAIALFHVALAVVVWRARPRSVVHRLFALPASGLAAWALGSALAQAGPGSQAGQALALIGAALLPPALLTFTMHYPDATHSSAGIAPRLAGAVGVFFATALVLTDWPIVPAFVMFIAIVLGATLTAFAKRWRRAAGDCRTQLACYGVGLSIASGGALIANVGIFGHLGPYLSVPLTALTAYGLVHPEPKETRIGPIAALAMLLLVVPLVAVLLIAAHPLLTRVSLVELEVMLAAGIALGVALLVPPIGAWVERAFHRHVDRPAPDGREAARAEGVATLRRLTQMLAHEIANPLVPIKTLTKMLPARAGDPAFASDVARIVARELERIEGLVGKLRRLAPTEEPVHTTVDLRVPLRHAIEVVGSEAAGHATRIDVRLTASPVPVCGDSAELEELFLNLLTNAIEAVVDRDTERSILISVAIDREHAVATVRDSGPGIGAEVMPRLFETCVTTKHRGSGLGLAICKTIAERHRGRLTAANAAEGGAMFVLELPVAV